jgi:transposase
MFSSPCIQLLLDSVKSQLVSNYFQNTLLPVVPKGSVIIWDNARFHHSSSAQDQCLSAGVTLIYLPAYSPDLNPVEHFWARLKKHLRSLLPSSFDPLLTIKNSCSFFSQKLPQT